MTHFSFSEELPGIIESFNKGRTIYLTSDGREEDSVLFESGFSQDSPISPILYLIYSRSLIPRNYKKIGKETSYVDDEFLLQGANQQSYATRQLQEKTDRGIAKTPYLNITLAKWKSKLMHISKPGQTDKDSSPILVDNEEIKPAQSIKSLGIIID